MQTDKVREEHDEDMSIQRAISIVFDRRPELRFFEHVSSSLFGISLQQKLLDLLKLVLTCRLEGLAHKVLQWYLCRMEGWFAADAETISLKSWDKASLIS